MKVPDRNTEIYWLAKFSDKSNNEQCKDEHTALLLLLEHLGFKHRSDLPNPDGVAIHGFPLKGAGAYWLSKDNMRTLSGREILTVDEALYRLKLFIVGRMFYKVVDEAEETKAKKSHSPGNSLDGIIVHTTLSAEDALIIRGLLSNTEHKELKEYFDSIRIAINNSRGN